jgi:type I restriction-modification system DNA methylase subunit/predicted DNA-binding transcriptional regulator AlpA
MRLLWRCYSVLNENQTSGELLTTSEVAELAGVRSSAVSNWRKRHEDFPKPFAGSGKRPVFSASEVREWMKVHEVYVPEPVSDDSMTGDFWRLMDSQRASGKELAVNKTLLLAGLIWATNVEPQEERVLQMLREIYEANPSTDQDHTEALRYLNWAPDSYEKVAEVLLDITKRNEQPSKRSSNSTASSELASALAVLLAPTESASKDQITIFDPCVGTGRALLKVADEWSYPQLVGQEINTSTGALARLLFALKGHDEGIAIGNSLEKDCWPRLKAEVVVAEPPFGLRLSPDQRHDPEWLNDPRWVLGSPGNDATNAWIQIVLSHLSDKGNAAVVVQPGWAWNSRSKEIRAALIRQNLLDGVIALPPRALSGPHIGGLLLLLSKNREARAHFRAPGEVFMADFSAKDPESSIAWPHFGAEFFVNWRDHNLSISTSGVDALEKATGKTLDGFSTEKAPVDGAGDLLTELLSSSGVSAVLEQDLAARDSFTQVVTYEDLSTEDFNLNPGRYQKLPEIEKVSLSEALVESTSLTKSALAGLPSIQKSLEDLQNFYASAQSGNDVGAQLVDLKSLESEGALAIIVGSGVGRKNDPTAELADVDTPRLLTRTNFTRIGRKENNDDVEILFNRRRHFEQESIVQVGDVILYAGPSVHGPTQAVIATEAEAGTLLGRELFALRLIGDHTHLSPEIVAVWAKTKHFSHQVDRLSTGTMITRIKSSDLRKFVIPVPNDAVTKEWLCSQSALVEELLRTRAELNAFVRRLALLEAELFYSIVDRAET